MLNASTALLALTAVAVFYGVAWTVMNVYNYYPVARAAVERVVTGTPTTDVAFVGTEHIELVGDGVYPDIDVFVPGYNEQDVIVAITHDGLRDTGKQGATHDVFGVDDTDDVPVGLFESVVQRPGFVRAPGI